MRDLFLGRGERLWKGGVQDMFLARREDFRASVLESHWFVWPFQVGAVGIQT
jgi:hypothetical protein